jgi:hypothetical protein
VDCHLCAEPFDLGWIAYASHEGTVAFGGLLASALSATWRNLEEWRWSGW